VDRSIFAVASGSTWKVTAEQVEDWSHRDCDASTWDKAIGTPEQFADEDQEAQAAAAEISPLLEAALARWCEQHDLPEQARFHWTRLLVFQPQNQEAMQALDLVRVGNQLLTTDQAAAERKAAHEKAVATKHWLTVLQRVRKDLDDASAPKRLDVARATLRKADISSIPAFEALLENRDLGSGAATHFTREYIHAVLANSLEPETTQALVKIALAGPESGRKEAIEQLRLRDFIAYVPQLMGSLKGTLEVSAGIEIEADGSAVCKATYSQQGIYEDQVRIETHRFQLQNAGGSGGRTKQQVQADARERAERLQAEIEAKVASINSLNLAANRPIFVLLRGVTDQVLPDDAAPWWTWWKDYNELMRPPKNPVRTTQYFDAQFLRYNEVRRRREKDCFVAETPVWTSTGLRPIDTIMPGDTVLAQDQETGELAYKVVLGVSMRPPHELLALTAGGETIVGTRGHRFWQRGPGWTMAKNLTVGAPLHTIHGEISVENTAPAEPQPTYNLIVDGFNTYFVGRAGLLVHDNGIPTPTAVTTPGLRASSR
jgi:hypothetical protein